MMPAYKQLLQILEYVVTDSESAKKFGCGSIGCKDCIFNTDNDGVCVLITKKITDKTLEKFLHNYVNISEREEEQDEEKAVDIPF